VGGVRHRFVARPVGAVAADTGMDGVEARPPDNRTGPVGEVRDRRVWTTVVQPTSFDTANSVAPAMS
jgi:hypothetical protein